MKPNRNPKTLTELKREIKSAYSEFQEGVRTTVDRANRLGELLIAVKHALPGGKFQAWVQDNCPFAPGTAREYMIVHRHWDRIKTDEDLQYQSLTNVVRLLCNRRPRERNSDMLASSFDRLLSTLEQRLSEVAAVHSEIAPLLDVVEQMRRFLDQHNLLKRAPRAA